MRRTIVGLEGLAVLAVGIAGQASGVAAQSAASTCKNPTAQPPNRGYKDQLLGVTATSGCKAWAVGSYVRGGRSRTLVEYWNGRTWWVQKSPNPGRYGDGLNAVSASSPTNAWAVGHKTTRKAGGQLTLVLHWNGRAWRVQASPNPGTRYGHGLSGVAATSRTNAWAVGSANYGGRSADYPRVGDQPLIEHWDGNVWKVQKSPIFPPHPRDNFQPQSLNDVGAVSPSSAWAVGYIDRGSGYGPMGLIEHWNGKAWKAQPDGAYGAVYGVALSSPNKAWAVGANFGSYCGSSSPCVYWDSAVVGRWNGKAWKLQKSPTPGHFSNLYGVAQTSTTNAWAVGDYCMGSDKRCTPERSLIERWNGKTWKVQNSANPGGITHDTELSSVAATSTTNAWAVGWYGTGRGKHALALHWDGTHWSP